MIFADYVDGKTIAIVGPAPTVGNQTAEIDAHDLVYRPAHSISVDHYTDRADIIYLNGRLGRTIYEPEWEHLLEKAEAATFWVCKGQDCQQRRKGFWRVAHRPDQVHNPNAITGMLFDLAQCRPASISVYGADLYASGPGNAYAAGYTEAEVGRQAQGIILHRPLEQMALHRAVHKRGLTVGDDRYLAAVTMPDDDYRAVIEAWKAVYVPWQAAHPEIG